MADYLIEGLHANIDMQRYISDPCPEPSLSTGVVCTLNERTPAHAMNEHPRLGGASDAPSSRGDIGSAVHALVLGGQEVVYAPGDFQDWRKKDAQEFRDAARDDGCLPLLAKDRPHVVGAASAAMAALLPLGMGSSEQTLIWRNRGVWCRGRADWLSDKGSLDVDIKTCDSADPALWIRRTMLAGGLDIQAELRAMGHEALGHRREVRFLLVELAPPYATSFVGIGNTARDLARRKIEKAVTIWGQCLATGSWPGYGSLVHYAEAPPWAEWDFETRNGGSQL